MGIRHALFVAGTIGRGDQPETMPLIEATRLRVVLERPEIELGSPFSGSRQESLTHTLAVPDRIDIKMVEPIEPRRGKSDRLTPGLCNPDFRCRKDMLLKEGEILVRRVEIGQIRQAGLAHVAVQTRNGRHVGQGGAAQGEVGHYSARTRVGGKITSTRVPSLGWLVICSAPRFASTSALVSGNPRPVPPRLREVAS